MRKQKRPQQHPENEPLRSTSGQGLELELFAFNGVHDDTNDIDD